MAVTRLGLSGTPRAALKETTIVVASLASWTWTPLAATVAVDRAITANLAQWEWTPLAANVDLSRTINASLVSWEWSSNTATVALENSVQASLAQWTWTPLQASVSAVPDAVSVTANLAQWEWTTFAADVTISGAAPIPDGRHTVYAIPETRTIHVSRENRTLIGMNQ